MLFWNIKIKGLIAILKLLKLLMKIQKMRLFNKELEKRKIKCMRENLNKKQSIQDKHQPKAVLTSCFYFL